MPAGNKDNQPNLHADLHLFFAEERGQPDFGEPLTLANGRIESRAIRTSARLNDYLDVPGVGLAFLIERHTEEMKTGKTTTETVYGVTGQNPDTADAARVPGFNRGHWTIENGCHYILDWDWDWDWDWDSCTIRISHGSAHITALRCFAIGLIKAKSRDTVSANIQRLARNLRLVFDYLSMRESSRRRPPVRLAPVG